MKRIFLVSCVKTKIQGHGMAKDINSSAWFKKARRLVENSGSDWYILSGKYGLVHSDEEISSYNQTVKNMRKKERIKWSERVIAKMKEELPEADEVVIFAGKEYREFLMDYLNGRYKDKIEIPMGHLRNGEQLRWLNEHRDKYKE